MALKDWWNLLFGYSAVERNTTSLCQAVEENNIRLLDYLLLEPSAFRAEDWERAIQLSLKQQTSDITRRLFLAIQKDCLQLLLRKSVEQNDVELLSRALYYGAKPEEWMISKGRTVKTVRLLLTYMDDFDINEKISHLEIDGEKFSLCTLLHVAAKIKDIDFAKYLLSRGANINVADHFGNTPIHFAKDTQTIEFLLSYGADINAKNAKGNTLIHSAKNLEMLEFLLKNNADINIISDYGYSVLHTAVVANDIDMVKRCLGLKLKINAKITPSDNVFWEHFDYFFLDNRYVIDSTFNDNLMKDGFTALHLAKSYEMVKLLIENGANVNAKDANGYTPLHTLYQDAKIMKLLLENGADINAKTINGHTILHIAVANDDIDTVSSLLDSGLDVNAVVKARYKKAVQNGRTPLCYARSYEMAKLLIECGADVNATDCNNCTPLYFMSNHSIIELLLSHGAVVGLRGIDGDMIKHTVHETKTVKLLMSHGVSQNLICIQEDQNNAPHNSNKKPIKISRFTGHVKIKNIW